MSSIYRVRTSIVGGNGGNQVATHYFDATSPFTAQDAADAVHAFWDTMKTQVISAYSFQVEPVVETINSTTGQPTGSVAVSSPLVTGTAGGGMIASSSQLLLRWRTGFYPYGREIRGRTFIPGLALSALGASGRPSAGALSTMASAATAIIGWTSSNFVVYSREHKVWALVSAGDPWAEFSVLRSRRQ
jgi:hypothetical protein